MASLGEAVRSLLGGLLRRLLSRSERQRKARVLQSRVDEARSRYRSLTASERQELRDAARRMASVRDRLAALTGSPSCCSDCAKRLARVTGQPSPTLEGGHCCGGDMDRIFDETEVAALWLAGRAPSRRSMVTDPVGCFYRGTEGCRLAPADRPSICGRYLCSDLTQALARTGALSDILECADALEVDTARISSVLGTAPAWPSPDL